MFTGIVEDIGVVKKISHQKNLSVLEIEARKALSGTKAGDSIAVNGVCLTVIKKKLNGFIFDIMKESLAKTSVGALQAKDLVNLERAVKASGRFSGHFVTGHVDGVGKIKSIKSSKNYREIVVGLSQDLMKYIVPKGSVCIDGVSLTVGKIARGFFSVYLIPFTLKVTTLGRKQAGDVVNIETDILAKYILK